MKTRRPLKTRKIMLSLGGAAALLVVALLAALTVAGAPLAIVAVVAAVALATRGLAAMRRERDRTGV